MLHIMKNVNNKILFLKHTVCLLRYCLLHMKKYVFVCYMCKHIHELVYVSELCDMIMQLVLPSIILAFSIYKITNLCLKR